MQEELGTEKREQLNTIEAALFVSGKAMSVEELSKVTGIASIGHVKRLADELIEEYTGRNSSIYVAKIGERYALSIREQYASKVSSIAGQPELTKGAMRVLAYVSKNEPLVQSSAVRAFGSSVYVYVKELIENDFIKATRQGRSKKLETTNKFKEYFNFSK
ncbi:MAG TPA: SMC-Scp complex subunit ScpB [Candidatus Acidoferrum sp.]|nr:SMC-Scp complex subunit ScpB [Candidatus Acidoferrum sp.]